MDRQDCGLGFRVGIRVRATLGDINPLNKVLRLIGFMRKV